MTATGALRAVLFDIDGTLVDSNDAHARSWVDAFDELGMRVAFDAVRPLIGMGTEKLIAALGVDIDLHSPRGRKLLDRRRSLFLDRELPGVRPFPGAQRLVELVRQAGARRIVASSSSPPERKRLLALAGLTDLFDDAVPPDDVEAGKPDADTVAAALARNGLPPPEAVMIGDTPYDIESAHGAGVRCIAFRCGGSEDARLAAADAVYDGPAELAAAIERSSLDAALRARAVRRSARPPDIFSALRVSFAERMGRIVS